MAIFLFREQRSGCETTAANVTKCYCRYLIHIKICQKTCRICIICNKPKKRKKSLLTFQWALLQRSPPPQEWTTPPAASPSRSLLCLEAVDLWADLDWPLLTNSGNCPVLIPHLHLPSNLTQKSSYCPLQRCCVSLFYNVDFSWGCLCHLKSSLLFEQVSS